MNEIIKLKTLHAGDTFRRPTGTFVYTVTKERIDHGNGNSSIWCLNPDGTRRLGTGDYNHSGNEDVVLVKEFTTSVPVATFEANEGDTVIVKVSETHSFSYTVSKKSANIVVEVKPNPWRDITEELVPEFLQSQKSPGKYIVLTYNGEIAVRYAHSGRRVTDGYKLKDCGRSSCRVYHKDV